MMLIKITRESVKFIGSRSVQESFINMSLYYHIPHSITTAVITFMVGHLFQNYDTIYVRFFATYTCDLSCFVGFFFPEVCDHFLLKRAYICAQQEPICSGQHKQSNLRQLPWVRKRRHTIKRGNILRRGVLNRLFNVIIGSKSLS